MFEIEKSKKEIEKRVTRTIRATWKKVVIGMACLATIFFMAVQIRDCFRLPDLWRYDFVMRYNEIACAHAGINPYHIFAGEIASDKYVSLAEVIQGRVAKDDERSQKGRVCAYPPWHVAYAWFYGWLSWGTCVTVFQGMLLFLCLLTVGWAWRMTQKGARSFVFSILSAYFLAPALLSFWVGNYGLVILCFSLLLYWSLETKKNTVAGLCWAVMMCKPQIAVLFFWPLLFQRRWVTIGVATMICLLATTWAAIVYQESPIDLVFQIPKMVPSSSVGEFAALFNRVFGGSGELITMIGGFFVCGLLSFYFRNASTWILRFAPPLLIFPVWTYSQPHDFVVMFPLFVLIASFAGGESRGSTAERKKQEVVQLLTFSLSGVALFRSVWMLTLAYGWFDPSGLGWIFRATTGALFLILCCCVIIIHGVGLSDKNSRSPLASS